MKKHEIYKTIHLFIVLILAAFAGVKIFFDPDVYYNVVHEPSLGLLCALLWGVFLVSFIFIYLDFRYFFQYKKDYRELDLSVKSDPISGINNRFSVDVLIEKYLDKPLPKDMGCIMIDLTNIQEINKQYGHVQGNLVIREFSDLLSDASKDLCFVGRNGGNKFLALFEKTTEEKMTQFTERLQQKVEAYNQKPTALPVEYQYGKAFHEGEEVQMITQLIALSNRRIVR